MYCCILIISYGTRHAQHIVKIDSAGSEQERVVTACVNTSEVLQPSLLHYILGIQS